MTKETIIGISMKSLSREEMNNLFGGNGADADVRSTPICSAGISFIATYLGSAATNCGKDNKK
ncbi:lichenicidin A2 family type 2 lantibiotic [Bacillus subtilis]|uniref:lichenicidin A2 family type 2 lantibiotic n=1 Tax=Bacillus subtilis TaxID=1423 RepID=UPI000E72B72C|nr:lichenicidin A2 family type 2 lantibiotic [Bacillus subtilis]MED1811065.1 lichenicidin A2 family type 2 lantibiotic [Bacillus subtilis]RJS52952.1 type 2 lantibiotic [Bacillus subtilis]UQZ53035.1 type 2 lantibiotic [Bacillus subtilis]UQZ68587.1 type 2 lantibiotic [Bacillus subtilis PY79]UQZ69124.1 type 2 lantibiotic [Bacillus subtilis]